MIDVYRIKFISAICIAHPCQRIFCMQLENILKSIFNHLVNFSFRKSHKFLKGFKERGEQYFSININIIHMGILFLKLQNNDSKFFLYCLVEEVIKDLSVPSLILLNTSKGPCKVRGCVLNLTTKGVKTERNQKRITIL